MVCCLDNVYTQLSFHMHAESSRDLGLSVEIIINEVILCWFKKVLWASGVNLEGFQSSE